MTETSGRRIKCVLVALDASPDSRAAAAAGARLAAALEAELSGLFVEDRDLLRLGDSLQAHQVGFLTAAVEQVDPASMRSQLRAQAARARRLLTRLAEHEGVACSFRVTRGQVSAEIQAAAARGVLVSVGRVGWSPGRRRRLGSTALSLLGHRGRQVLIADRGTTVAPPVVVLYEGSGADIDALDLAARLAPRTAGGLIVLATGPEAQRQAARRLGERASETRFELLAAPPATALAAATRRCRAGLLVLPLGGPWSQGVELQQLLGELRCPVLALS